MRNVPNKVKSLNDGKRIPEYAAWHAIRQRCNYPKHYAYKDYGGRGIKVCDRWMDSFDNFIEDMGFRPGKGYTLDRIDNDGNYEPSNCRWATWKTQQNNRRNNRIIEHDGLRMTKSEWGNYLGVNERYVFANKKRTDAENIEQFKKGGGRPCIRIEYNGQYLTIRQWSEIFKVCPEHVCRLIKKKPFEEIYNYFKNKQK